MAMAAVAIPAAVSLIESMMSKSGDDATRAAGNNKIAAMRQGAQQYAAYRPELEAQMMQAMQNRMGAYGGAQNVLSQMYGGQQPPRPAPPMGPPGPAINPGTAGGARAGANPYFGQTFAPPMGFGGAQPGMPMPWQLHRAV